MSVEIDQVYWSLTAKIDPKARQAIQAMRKEMRQASAGSDKDGAEGGRRFGEAWGRAIVASAARSESAAARAGQKVGEAAGQGFARGADAKLRDSRGRFHRAGEDAGSAISAGMGSAISSGQGGIGGAIERLTGFVRGLLLIQLIGIAVQAGRALMNAVREPVEKAQEAIRSYMRIGAEAKLLGVQKEVLAGIARTAREEFQVEAVQANNLAVAVGKLAVKSGETARSQELLAKSLDLGAAKGYTAAQTAAALEQALLGIDEGTDKLLGKNPSTIYDEFAASIGTTAGKLTDMQKTQAIANAVMDAGTRVAGSYAAALAEDSGQLEVQRTRTEALKTALGTALLPMVADAARAFNDILGPAIGYVIEWLNRMQSPLDQTISRLRELGATAAEVLPLELKRSLRDQDAEIDRLRRATRTARTVRGPEVRGEGRTTFTSRVFDGRSVPALEAELRDLEAIALRGAAAGRALTDRQLARRAEIARILEAEKALNQALVARANTQNRLAFAEQDAARYANLRDIEARIARLRAMNAEQGESIANMRQIEALEARAAEERKKLGMQQNEPTPPAPTPTNPSRPTGKRRGADPVEQARENLNRITAQLEDQVASLTNSAVESARRALDKLYAEAVDSARTAGVALSAEVTGFFDRLRADLDNQELAEKLGRNLEKAINDESIPAIQEMVAEIARAAGETENGSRAQKRMNELLGRAQKAVRDVTAAKRQQAKEDREATAQEERREKEKRSRRKREAEDARRESRQRWADAARDIAGMVDAFAELIDLLGVGGDETRRFLANLSEMAEGAQAIAQGIASGDPVSIVRGGIGVLRGGAAMLGVGETEDERRAADQLRVLISDLTNALRELKDAILNEVSSAQIRSDIATAERAAQILDTGGYGRGGLENLARQLGLVGADANQDEALAALEAFFRDFDERYGTNLAAMVASGDREALMRALEQLPAALREELTQQGGFGTDPAGIMERVRWEASMNDAIDSVELLTRTFEALVAAGKNLGDFADELEELSGLDLSTDAGRQRRDEIVAAMVAAVAAGGADFGDLTPAQLRQLIEEWARATPGEGGGAAAGGGDQSTRLNVNMTQEQGSQLVAGIFTVAMNTAYLPKIFEALTGIPLGPLPPMSPPAVAPAAGGTTTVYVDVTFEGDIRLDPGPGGVGTMISQPQAAEEMGRRATGGFAGGLSESILAGLRGAGASGPVSIVTRLPGTGR